MAKNALMIAINKAQEEKLKLCSLIARQQTLDKVVIALGKMGMSPADLAYFEEVFRQTEKEFCEEVLSDTIIDKNGKEKPDNQLWYAKKSIDEAIKEYVGEENFVPYEERYKF